MGYAIRDEQFRYVLWLEEGRHKNPEADLSKVADTQLFDYEKDPLETVNVSGNEVYREIEGQLRGALYEWLMELNL